MCGITGFVDFRRHSSKEILKEMVATLAHRGPNDYGANIYNNSYAQVGFGHTRLSIIDLSKAGRQPMYYQNLTIVFNGEIYNYKEIKNKLIQSGHSFQTLTDTEVILHAHAEWGKSAVNYFIGMFSYIIYNDFTQEVTAFRDRAGVKPFYYYYKNGLFLFSSELKAFHNHPKFEKIVDQKALNSYFNYGFIPAPQSIFENTLKLEAGQSLSLNFHTKGIAIETYWNVGGYYRKPKQEISYKEAKEEVHSLLKSACNYRMIGDVPIGVFLSGGYDSTAVTSILQNDRTKSLKTFTIGFEEGNNEAPYAQEIAKYLGTDHYEYICTIKEAQEIIPDLPFYYDEPFADSSAIPTILVSRFAKQHVKVSLSADGGDEIFAGYHNYISLVQKLNCLNRIPNRVKTLAKYVLSLMEKVIPISNPALKHKLHSASKSINRNNYQQASDLFRLMNSLPISYQKNLFQTPIGAYNNTYSINSEGFNNEIELALAVDYQMYLQNDILTKVDRATMSTSLEGREPLLDHRLIEYVATLPFHYKYDGRSTKRLLKDIVHDYVPQKIMDRPKTGFSLPIYHWLNKDLRWLVCEYLNEEAIAASKLLNVEFVLKQTKLFQQGKLHYKPLIWKLLMFQMWYQRWM